MAPAGGESDYRNVQAVVALGTWSKRDRRGPVAGFVLDLDEIWEGILARSAS